MRYSSASFWFPKILFPSQTAAREFIKTIFSSSRSRKICRYIKCITRGFVSANEASERGEEESIFIRQGRHHSDVTFQFTFRLKYFSAVASHFVREFWKNKFRSMIFFVSQIFACRTHIDWNVVGCHHESKSNYVFPTIDGGMSARKNEFDYSFFAFLTFGNEARTCCLTSHSNLSTGNCRHL